ncbi:hypothetical protein Bbelb_192150 [Branchiostoma belcheri]|nr:hypothetical protein Bbelb_192150 [Branchiostoma belcheri]
MRLTVRALALVVRDGKLNTYVKQSKLWRPGEVWPVVAMVTVGSALCGFVYRTKCYVGQQGRRALTPTRLTPITIPAVSSTHYKPNGTGDRRLSERQDSIEVSDESSGDWLSWQHRQVSIDVSDESSGIGCHANTDRTLQTCLTSLLAWVAMATQTARPGQVGRRLLEDYTTEPYRAVQLQRVGLGFEPSTFCSHIGPAQEASACEAVRNGSLQCSHGSDKPWRIKRSRLDRQCEDGAKASLSVFCIIVAYVCYSLVQPVVPTCRTLFPEARPWPLRHGTITNFGAAADVYVDVCPTAPAHIKTWSFRKLKQTTPRKQRQPAARYFTVLRCPLTKYTAATMPLKLARAAPRLIRDGRLLKYGRPKIWKAGEVWPVIAMVTIGGAFLGMAIRTKSYVGNQGHREHYKHDEE